MADDIFSKLRAGNNAQPRQDSPYSFRGSAAPQQQPQSSFSSRPGTTTGGPTISRPTTTGGEPLKAPFHPPRDANGDRQNAYEPPAVRRREDEGDMYEWKPPGFADILADLGLRILEVGLASAAYAIGEEIAYFFKKRRFHADTKSRYTRD